MKYLRYIALLLASSVTLTSCPGKKLRNIYSDIPDIEAAQPDSGAGYAKQNSYSYSLSDVHSSVGMYNLNSTGNAKILVVPVMARGSVSWTNSMLNNLKKGFFGKESDTGWQSVYSYYHYSSFGNLEIGGEVAPVLKSQYSVAQLIQRGYKDGETHPDSVIIEEFESSSTYQNLRKKYDTDGNGYIDSVVFIYSNQIDSDSGFWAWVYWGDSNPSASAPTVNTYMWASYDFLVQSKNSKYVYAAYGNKLDCHTYIHETGHMLGLDDYYCYDKNGWDPSGKLEMHSYNVGDDSIYSKMLLGWSKPYYVKTTDSVTLTLRTSAGYGDSIIINDNWNHSICDEYLAIEYYSPHGMNGKDASEPYPGNGLQMYTKSGFRIYHIDSRIVELGARGKMVSYADSIQSGKYYMIGASNSESYSYLNEHAKDYKLLHLLEAGGVNTFKSGKAATNATLFTQGNEFTASSEFFYNGTKFNDNSAVGYKITIGECSEFTGTVTITKI